MGFVLSFQIYCPQAIVLMSFLATSFPLCSSVLGSFHVQVVGCSVALFLLFGLRFFLFDLCVHLRLFGVYFCLVCCHYFVLVFVGYWVS